MLLSEFQASLAYLSGSSMLSFTESSAGQWMSRQKIDCTRPDDPIGHIFQQIVAGIVEQMVSAVWKTSAPLPIIIHIEHEIVPSPQDQHGDAASWTAAGHAVDNVKSGSPGASGMSWTKRKVASRCRGQL
jgi:hypothetical protein